MRENNDKDLYKVFNADLTTAGSFFNEDGVCNACTNAQEKQQVDWEARAREFAELVEKIDQNPVSMIVSFHGVVEKTFEHDCAAP